MRQHAAFLAAALAFAAAGAAAAENHRHKEPGHAEHEGGHVDGHAEKAEPGHGVEHGAGAEHRKGPHGHADAEHEKAAHPDYDQKVPEIPDGKVVDHDDRPAEPHHPKTHEHAAGSPEAEAGGHAGEGAHPSDSHTQDVAAWKQGQEQKRAACRQKPESEARGCLHDLKNETMRTLAHDQKDFNRGANERRAACQAKEGSARSDCLRQVHEDEQAWRRVQHEKRLDTAHKNVTEAHHDSPGGHADDDGDEGAHHGKTADGHGEHPKGAPLAWADVPARLDACKAQSGHDGRSCRHGVRRDFRKGQKEAREAARKKRDADLGACKDKHGDEHAYHDCRLPVLKAYEDALKDLADRDHQFEGLYHDADGKK